MCGGVTDGSKPRWWAARPAATSVSARARSGAESRRRTAPTGCGSPPQGKQTRSDKRSVPRINATCRQSPRAWSKPTTSPIPCANNDAVFFDSNMGPETGISEWVWTHDFDSLGELTKTSYQIAHDFRLPARRAKGRIAGLCNPLRNTAGGRKDEQAGNFFDRNRPNSWVIGYSPLGSTRAIAVRPGLGCHGAG
jgi:hypothetical protein